MTDHPEFVLDGEQIWPRSINERYGIFRVKHGGRPELVATCRTQGEIGTTLVRLGSKEENEFEDYVVGVMDGRDHKNDKGDWVGRWIVKPWVAKEDDASSGSARTGGAAPIKWDVDQRDR